MCKSSSLARHAKASDERSLQDVRTTEPNLNWEPKVSEFISHKSWRLEVCLQLVSRPVCDDGTLVFFFHTSHLGDHTRLCFGYFGELVLSGKPWNAHRHLLVCFGQPVCLAFLGGRRSRTHQQWRDMTMTINIWTSNNTNRPYDTTRRHLPRKKKKKRFPTPFKKEYIESRRRKENRDSWINR